MINSLGIDTGGTFTDFVLWQNQQIHVHKVLSTPEAPEQAILQGIQELGLDLHNLRIVHGSTVATNAVLEEKGVETLYISNHGFADLLTIGRQNRAELYNLQPQVQSPPVPRENCITTSGRLNAAGEALDTLTTADIENIQTAIQAGNAQAVAINMLFSYLNSGTEHAIAQAIREIDPDIFVSMSSEVLPEIKEYERGMATWLNAWVGPLVKGYLLRLQNNSAPAKVAVMQSTGQTVAAEQAGQQAVRMLLSGPAGGLVAARALSTQCGYGHLLSFDMGGTSTDISLLEGNPTLTNEGRIGRFPVAVPMVDMHTIGAGGGSIAWIDQGGMLQVGPQSAGASPGPASYGKGGQQAAVTDANLVLGRLQANAFLGGEMQLDKPKAEAAVQKLAEQLNQTVHEVASDIIAIANEHMARALRTISLQKGKDPQNYTLVSFGGAGGLHVCALAEAMNLQQALVPIHGGVLSALGMLRARPGRQLTRTHIFPVADTETAEIQKHLERLAQQGIDELVAEGIEAIECHSEFSVDMRYIGQSYTLNIAWQPLQQLQEAFHQAHKARYGHRLDLAVELVTLRAAVLGTEPDTELPQQTRHTAGKIASWHEVVDIEQAVPLYQRHTLSRGQQIKGPAIIAEQVATTWLDKDWDCEVDAWGNLKLNYQR